MGFFARFCLTVVSISGGVHWAAAMATFLATLSVIGREMARGRGNEAARREASAMNGRDRYYYWWFAVGSVPGSLLGMFLFQDIQSYVLRTACMTGVMMACGTIVAWAIGKFIRRQR